MILIKLIFILTSISHAKLNDVNEVFDNFKFDYQNQMSEFTNQLYIYSQNKSVYRIYHRSIGRVDLTAHFDESKSLLSYSCRYGLKVLEITGFVANHPSLYKFYEDIDVRSNVEIRYERPNKKVLISYKKDQSLTVKKWVNNDTYEYLITQSTSSVFYKKWINSTIDYSAQQRCSSQECMYSQDNKDDRTYDRIAFIHKKVFEDRLFELFQTLLNDFIGCI